MAQRGVDGLLSGNLADLQAVVEAAKRSCVDYPTDTFFDAILLFSNYVEKVNSISRADALQLHEVSVMLITRATREINQYSEDEKNGSETSDTEFGRQNKKSAGADLLLKLAQVIRVLSVKNENLAGDCASTPIIPSLPPVPVDMMEPAMNINVAYSAESGGRTSRSSAATKDPVLAQLKDVSVNSDIRSTQEEIAGPIILSVLKCSSFSQAARDAKSLLFDRNRQWILYHGIADSLMRIALRKEFLSVIEQLARLDSLSEEVIIIAASSVMRVALRDQDDDKLVKYCLDSYNLLTARARFSSEAVRSNIHLLSCVEILSSITSSVLPTVTGSLVKVSAAGVAAGVSSFHAAVNGNGGLSPLLSCALLQLLAELFECGLEDGCSWTDVSQLSKNMKSPFSVEKLQLVLNLPLCNYLMTCISVGYRKAALLSRPASSPVDEDDDSEPILGAWYEEVLSHNGQTNEETAVGNDGLTTVATGFISLSNSSVQLKRNNNTDACAAVCDAGSECSSTSGSSGGGVDYNRNSAEVHLQLALRAVRLIDGQLVVGSSWFGTYMSRELSVAHMVTLAHIVRDLELSSTGLNNTGCSSNSSQMGEFALSIHRLLHNLFARHLMSDELLHTLLTTLEINPWTCVNGKWPLEISSRCLAILAQAVLLHKDPEAAKVCVWQQVIRTLTEPTASASTAGKNDVSSPNGDPQQLLNVEHAQLLLYLFDSIPLMQRKEFLLSLVEPICNFGADCMDPATTSKPLNGFEYLRLGQLLHLFEYLVKHLYAAPTWLSEQVTANILETSLSGENQTGLKYFAYKELEENFHMQEGSYRGRVRFFTLCEDSQPGQFPKFDGFAVSFLCASPSRYGRLYARIVDLLNVSPGGASTRRIFPSQFSGEAKGSIKSKLMISYAEMCGAQYVAWAAWRLLLCLPPSLSALSNLHSHPLLLCLLVPRLSHRTLSVWVRDGVAKQLENGDASAVIDKTLEKYVGSHNEVALLNELISLLEANCWDSNELFWLEIVLGKLQHTFGHLGDSGKEPNNAFRSQASTVLGQVVHVLQLCRATLHRLVLDEFELSQNAAASDRNSSDVSNVSQTPAVADVSCGATESLQISEGQGITTTTDAEKLRAAYDVVLEMASSRAVDNSTNSSLTCVTLAVASCLPEALTSILNCWNSSAPAAAPASGCGDSASGSSNTAVGASSGGLLDSWRADFAADPLPSESLLTAIAAGHIGAMSKTKTYSLAVPLKRVMHFALRFANDLYAILQQQPEQKENSEELQTDRDVFEDVVVISELNVAAALSASATTSYVSALVPLLLDATTESLSDFAALALQNVPGGYEELMHTQLAKHCYRLLTDHVCVMGKMELVFDECIKFLGSATEKPVGRYALVQLALTSDLWALWYRTAEATPPICDLFTAYPTCLASYGLNLIRLFNQLFKLDEVVEKLAANVNTLLTLFNPESFQAFLLSIVLAASASSEDISAANGLQDETPSLAIGNNGVPSQSGLIPTSAPVCCRAEQQLELFFATLTSSLRHSGFDKLLFDALASVAQRLFFFSPSHFDSTSPMADTLLELTSSPSVGNYNNSSDTKANVFDRRPGDCMRYSSAFSAVISALWGLVTCSVDAPSWHLEFARLTAAWLCGQSQEGNFKGRVAGSDFAVIVHYQAKLAVALKSLNAAATLDAITGVPGDVSSDEQPSSLEMGLAGSLATTAPIAPAPSRTDEAGSSVSAPNASRGSLSAGLANAAVASGNGNKSNVCVADEDSLESLSDADDYDEFDDEFEEALATASGNNVGMSSRMPTSSDAAGGCVTGNRSHLAISSASGHPVGGSVGSLPVPVAVSVVGGVPSRLCTFTVTASEYMSQHWYHCHTCGLIGRAGACSVCARVCHFDHDVTYFKFSSFFCDCGARADRSCPAIDRRRLNAALAEIAQRQYNQLQQLQLQQRQQVAPAQGNKSATAGALPADNVIDKQDVDSSRDDKRLSTQSATSTENLLAGADGARVGPSSATTVGVEAVWRSRDVSHLARTLAPVEKKISRIILGLEPVGCIVENLRDRVLPRLKEHWSASSAGCAVQTDKALRQVHEDTLRFETVENLMQVTVGSQEGAFENVKLSFGGDQQLRQLLQSHQLRRTAMCALSPPWGGYFGPLVATCGPSGVAGSNRHRQLVAVSHEKGKVTVLQLTTLLRQVEATPRRRLTITRLASAPVGFTVVSITANPLVAGLKHSPAGSSGSLSLTGSNNVSTIGGVGSAVTAGFASCDDHVAVCGIKECHILAFSGQTGSLVNRLVVNAGLEGGLNFIIKAIWLPGSQTELAIVTAEFVKIFDLSHDASNPRFHFILASGNVRDATFMRRSVEERYMMVMSTNGFIYYQQLGDDCLAAGGSFYVTNVLLLDCPGINGSGGTSVYYSHAMQMLFASFTNAKSLVVPLTQMDGSLSGPVSVIELSSANTSGNGNSRTIISVGEGNAASAPGGSNVSEGASNNNNCTGNNNSNSNLSNNSSNNNKLANSSNGGQPLVGWTELPQHPGLILSLQQFSNNPVAIMIRPGTSYIQEIRLPSAKSKISDMVALRHQPPGAFDMKTNMIVLCEDGSLKVFTANPHHTNYWLDFRPLPIATSPLLKCTRNRSAAKSERKHSVPAGGMTAYVKTPLVASSISSLQVPASPALGGKPTFPIDFFEHCNQLQEIEFEGNDLLEVYNREQLKLRLLSNNSLFVVCTKSSGFKLEIVNTDTNVVITGIRLAVGSQDLQRVPAFVELFGRTLQLGSVCTYPRWFDLPLTREETLQAEGKRVTLTFGVSADPAFVTILDSVKVYGRTKEAFGWPEECEPSSDVVGVNGVALAGLGFNGVRAKASADSELEQQLHDSLRLIEAYFVFSDTLSTRSNKGNNFDDLKCRTLDLVSQLLLLPLPSPQLQTSIKGLLSVLQGAPYATPEGSLNSLMSYKEEALVACVQETLAGRPDGEAFYRLTSIIRSVIVGTSVSNRADAAGSFLSRGEIVDSLMAHFWRLLSRSPDESFVSSVNRIGLVHADATLQNLVEILYALLHVTTTNRSSAAASISGDVSERSGSCLYTSALVRHIVDLLLHPLAFIGHGTRYALIRTARSESRKNKATNIKAKQVHEEVLACSLHTDAEDLGGASTVTGSADTDGDQLTMSPAATESIADKRSSALIEEMLCYVWKRLDNGVTAIPFLQVVLALLERPEHVEVLVCMATVIAESITVKWSKQGEVQLLLLKLCSILLSRKSQHLSNATAKHLLAAGILDRCYSLLSTLLQHWKRSSIACTALINGGRSVVTATCDTYNSAVTPCISNSGSGGGGFLLKRQRLDLSFVDMLPFFSKTYVRAHAGDVFEDYPELLTETVLRLCCQLWQHHKSVEAHKVPSDQSQTLASDHLSEIPPSTCASDSNWHHLLCELMMTPAAAAFAKKSIRKVLMLLCGSRERYREVRDLHAFSVHMNAVRKSSIYAGVCLDIDNLSSLYGADSFDNINNDISGSTFAGGCGNSNYDALMAVMEHLKSCVDVATLRITNWQRFCLANDRVLRFLLQLSFSLDDGIAPAILRLLQLAIHSNKRYGNHNNDISTCIVSRVSGKKIGANERIRSASSRTSGTVHRASNDTRDDRLRRHSSQTSQTCDLPRMNRGRPAEARSLESVQQIREPNPTDRSTGVHQSTHRGSLTPKASSKSHDSLARQLVTQLNSLVDAHLLNDFLISFLLDSNTASIRWQAHSFVYHLFEQSTFSRRCEILRIMWNQLWPQLPLYGRKAAQFVDLLGYFTLSLLANRHSSTQSQKHGFRLSHGASGRCDDVKPACDGEYFSPAYYCAQILSVLRRQNRLIERHPNAWIYNEIQGLVDFDNGYINTMGASAANHDTVNPGNTRCGYYLECEPCLVCNNPETPFASVKLSQIKVDSRFTTSSQIVKLIGSQVISCMTLRIGDIKKSKIIKTVNIYYNNRTVQSVVDLRHHNREKLWNRARSCFLTPGQTELRIEFPLPIVACNLMIEFAEFYENPLAAADPLQCPRCSTFVSVSPGVCSNCGEQVFQCHKCRQINYDEKDPFLCNNCGYCRYAKFDLQLYCKQCCTVNPIESDDERKKVVALMNSQLEQADRSYTMLTQNFRPELEELLARIYERTGIAVDDKTDVSSLEAFFSGLNASKYSITKHWCLNHVLYFSLFSGCFLFFILLF